MTLRAFHCFSIGAHDDANGQRIALNDAAIRHVAASFNAKRAARKRVDHSQPVALVAHHGALFAVYDVAHSQIREMRNAPTQYVTAAFHLPGHPNNPTPGKHHLSRVVFLPAPLSFEDSRGICTVRMPFSAAVPRDAFGFAACVSDPSEPPEAVIVRVSRDVLRYLPGLRFRPILRNVSAALAAVRFFESGAESGQSVKALAS